MPSLIWDEKNGGMGQAQDISTSQVEGQRCQTGSRTIAQGSHSCGSSRELQDTPLTKTNESTRGGRNWFYFSFEF